MSVTPLLCVPRKPFLLPLGGPARGWHSSSEGGKRNSQNYCPTLPKMGDPALILSEVIPFVPGSAWGRPVASVPLLTLLYLLQ